MRLLLSTLLLGLAAPLGAQSAAVATTSGGPHSRSSVTVTVPFGKPARINRQVYRPVAVVEDSRCPTQVNCVWRGRLVVEFAVGRQKLRLEDGKPLAVPGGRLILVSGTPHSLRGETFPPQQYRFQLRFESP
jgi:hypothetical protein